jgi:hypothetical protein
MNKKLKGDTSKPPKSNKNSSCCTRSSKVANSDKKVSQSSNINKDNGAINTMVSFKNFSAPIAKIPTPIPPTITFNTGNITRAHLNTTLSLFDEFILETMFMCDAKYLFAWGFSGVQTFMKACRSFHSEKVTVFDGKQWFP